MSYYMFSYYGSECFRNKSVFKQVFTLKKITKKTNWGSSNAQQKYTLKQTREQEDRIC